MRELPAAAQRFVLLVILCGALASGASFLQQDWLQAPLGALLFFVLAGTIAGRFGTDVAARGPQQIVISTDTAWLLAASLLFEPPQALLIAVSSSLLSELLARVAWYKTLFNASQAGLAAGAASLAFGHLSQLPGPPEAILALAGAAAGFLYYLINTTAVNTVYSLITQQSPLYTWRTSFGHVAVHNIGTISLAGLIAILWTAKPISVVLAAVPLLAIRSAIRHVTELRTQTREALIEIADVLDRRDPYTRQHSERVGAHARLLAQELGLPDEQVDLIYDATRLHDIGKVGMSNELLLKPGGLSDEEWREFRLHPGIGAEIVSKFPLFQGAREIVLHHQERYDGAGYPAGLQGKQIPLGARIIAVADAYDAMSSERPYRKPLPKETIVQELLRGKGTQFDPQLVDAFLLALARRGEIPASLLPAELGEDLRLQIAAGDAGQLMGRASGG